MEKKEMKATEIETNKIEETDTKKEKRKKRIRNNNFVRLLLAVLLLSGCAVLGMGIAIYEDKSNPMEYVAEYFGKFLMQKYDEMYDYVDTEGKCITKASFTNLMSELHAANNIGTYEFQEPEKEGGRYRVTISYKDAETEEEKEFSIYLIKSRAQWTQLVADWKVSVDEYLTDDFRVQVPEGMQLEVDGVIMDESSAVVTAQNNDTVQTAEGETIKIAPEDSEEMFSVYQFDKILKGRHTFRVLTDYTQIERDVDIQMKSQTLTFDPSQTTLKDNYLSLIETKTPEMIQEYYQVVRKKKTSSKKLLTYFKDDEKLVKKLKNLAGKDIDVIFWPDTKNIDDYSLRECNFSELKYNAFYAGNDQLQVTYQFSYEYVSSTDTALYSSYIDTISGTCTTTMELTYDVVDDGIILSDISIRNKNKKDEV